jgi:hypothetical protein
MNKLLYRIWLFAFDMWGKRDKKGKRAGIWIKIMDKVWPIIYNRTTLEERWEIYYQLTPKKKKCK